MKELRYNLSCRLFTDAKCFGPGVAQLLHRVERLHSLRAAAAEMEMAYSKAWTVIKNAENALGFKLLASTTGGRHGGGAALTPEGKALLAEWGLGENWKGVGNCILGYTDQAVLGDKARKEDRVLYV